MEIDALGIALLAACSGEHAVVHRIHGELEHWLNRPLATGEVEAALTALETRGLVAADRSRMPAAYLTTEAGRAVIAARWEEFFPA
jgi:hypothetical protein